MAVEDTKMKAQLIILSLILGGCKVTSENQDLKGRVDADSREKQRQSYVDGTTSRVALPSRYSFPESYKCQSGAATFSLEALVAKKGSVAEIARIKQAASEVVSNVEEYAAQFSCYVAEHMRIHKEIRNKYQPGTETHEIYRNALHRLQRHVSVAAATELLAVFRRGGQFEVSFGYLKKDIAAIEQEISRFSPYVRETARDSLADSRNQAIERYNKAITGKMNKINTTLSPKEAFALLMSDTKNNRNATDLSDYWRSLMGLSHTDLDESSILRSRYVPHIWLGLESDSKNDGSHWLFSLNADGFIKWVLKGPNAERLKIKRVRARADNLRPQSLQGSHTLIVKSNADWVSEPVNNVLFPAQTKAYHTQIYYSSEWEVFELLKSEYLKTLK